MVSENRKDGGIVKVTIAIDSLKGSLTSSEAGEAIKAGILKADSEADVCVRPLADGGEGTVEALISGMGGRQERITVTGPLGDPVECVYGIIGGAPPQPEASLAVIEMAAASGITLVPEEKRNPLYTTSYGTGEMIRDAIGKGCRRFIIGIGGSATNDGGVGMLQALGFGFSDAEGNQVRPGAQGLKEIVSISMEHVLPELSECSFRIACDVTNPLCGPNGCSRIFGPQKGATEQMIQDMDSWLSHLAGLTGETFPEKKGIEEIPGTGAAGGLGYAFLAFTNAVLESGIDIVLEETGLEEYIKGADIVVTGEGRLDAQTVMGKAPSGVANLAKKYGKPVIAFAGSVTEDATACNEHGIDAFFPILRRISTLEDAMEHDTAAKNLADTAEQVFRLVKSGK